MGNKSCVLGVQTEKRVFFSGEVVNGRIYLSVNDPNGVSAQAVKLHCSGIERGVVHYTEERDDDSNDGRRQIERYEENELPILNFDIPINTPVGSFFTKGQYEFPFTFVLPQNLPSSMYCKQWQSQCEVRYEMRAYLAKNSSSTFANLFNGNMISSNPLKLNICGNGNHNLYQINTNQLIFPGETYQVRNCCCCHRGQMSLRATLENGLFVPNQSQSLSFDLNNSSRAKVENVTVELIERVSWKPQFREEAHEFTLFKSVIDASATRNWMSTAQRIEETAQDYTSLSPIARGMGHGTEQIVNLSTPHNARDSYSGRLIQVEHFVRVKVVTHGVCVSNPETTADVTVMRPSDAFYNHSDNDGSLLHEHPSPAPPPMPSAPPFIDDEEEIIVEATVLPPDWSPLTSEVVTLPVADVVIVSNVENDTSKVQ